MSFMDFYFPEQAEAMHLRSISRNLRRGSISARGAARRTRAELEGMEEDLGFLALALFSLVGSLVERGVLDEDEIKQHMQRLDGLDGVEDGKLDTDAPRGALGLARKPSENPPAPQPRRRRR